MAIQGVQTTACLAFLINHAIGADSILHSFDVPGRDAARLEFICDGRQRSINVERIFIPLRRRQLLRPDVLAPLDRRSTPRNSRQQPLQCRPHVVLRRYRRPILKQQLLPAILERQRTSL